MVFTHSPIYYVESEILVAWDEYRSVNQQFLNVDAKLSVFVLDWLGEWFGGVD